MSLSAVQGKQQPVPELEDDGPSSDQAEPSTAWPSSFHYRSGTPRSRQSSPSHSPRPSSGPTPLSNSDRFSDGDSHYATTSFWGGLNVQRKSGKRKVGSAWFSKKRVKGLVGVIGLLVLYFVMNWVMLLRLQDHRLHTKSWFSGNSSSPAPISVAIQVKLFTLYVLNLSYISYMRYDGYFAVWIDNVIN